MSVPHALLGLLDVRPAHGYELKRAYDGVFGNDRPVAYAQVYTTLDRLERDRLVGVVAIEADGGPARTTYAITPSGVERFETWLYTPESPRPYLHPLLFSKVVLALRSGRSAEQVLDQQRAAHLELMRELTRTRRTAALVDALSADFALFHLEADLRWIELTADRLASLAKEIRP